MASQIDILNALAGEQGQISGADIAKKIGTKLNNINTTLKRMVDANPPLIEKDAETGGYTITEAGTKALNPISAETEGMTESSEFRRFGIAVGVSPAQAEIIQNHVWTGDYTDLMWVYKALMQNNVKKDWASRWANLWAGKLRMDVPDWLERETPQIGGTEGKAKTEEEKEAVRSKKGTHAFALDDNDMPMFVGEGMGNLEYQDAVDLSKIRNMRAAREAGVAAQTGTGINPLDRADKEMSIFEKMFTMMRPNPGDGDATKQKVMVVTNGPEGMRVEELDPTKPLIMQAPAPAAAPAANKHFITRQNEAGEWVMEEVDPNRPTIIQVGQRPQGGNGGASTAPARVYMFQDPETGAFTEWTPGMPPPVAPRRAAPAQESTMLPAELGGQKIAIRLDDYFALDKHKQEMEQGAESHKMKMELGGKAKDLIAKGVDFFGNMAGE